VCVCVCVCVFRVKSVLGVIVNNTKAREIATSIADAFIDRFNPKNKDARQATEARFEANISAINQRINA
jgi:hypothetical protein